MQARAQRVRLVKVAQRRARHQMPLRATEAIWPSEEHLCALSDGGLDAEAHGEVHSHAYDRGEGDWEKVVLVQQTSRAAGAALTNAAAVDGIADAAAAAAAAYAADAAADVGGGFAVQLIAAAIDGAAAAAGQHCAAKARQHRANWRQEDGHRACRTRLHQGKHCQQRPRTGCWRLWVPLSAVGETQEGVAGGNAVVDAL